MERMEEKFETDQSQREQWENSKFINALELV